MPPLLNNIDNSVVVYTPGAPEFEALVASILGNTATGADGFDATINAIMATFAAVDASLAGMGSDFAELQSAVDNFNALDTDSWASDFPAALSVLAPRPQAPSPNAPGGITLPSLPAPPVNNPAPPPPIHCQPSPGPTPTPQPPPPGTSPGPQPPPITPHLCPPGQVWDSTTGTCVQKCPPGWSYTSQGNCQPPPVQQGGTPPVPPVTLPPMPAGVPPCPQGYISTGSGGCVPGDASSSESQILMVLGDVVLKLTEKELVPVTASWVASFTGLSVATSALIIGALIGVAGLLITLLGGGCGSACIDSSKVEQVYEAIGDNLLRVAKAGMLGGSAAVVAITHFMGVGDQAEQRLGTSQATAGQKNMDTVMTNLIAVARKLPATASVPLDVTAAEKLYVTGPGWYPDSLAVAAQVTTQFLTAMAAPAPASSSS